MKTRKPYLTILVICCFTSMIWAQIVAVPDSSQAARQSQPTDQPELVQITVKAQATSDPAMKYQLLPSLADQTPGNAVLMYYMAQQVMPGTGDSHLAQKRQDQVTKYLEMPLSELPKQEVSVFLNEYSPVLRQIETGAMREDADWGLPLDEGVTMMMPSLSSFRQVAKVLALQARMEIAQGSFDEAVHTIQVGMAMGRHIGDGKGTVLISSLVGMAIESIMVEQVRELIVHGGPNMYWALAGLDMPLIDMKLAMEYERLWVLMSIPAFRAMKGQIGPAEGADLLRGITEIYSIASANGEPRLGEEVLAQAGLAVRYYNAGKKALIERGLSRAEVDAMPVSQVVATYLWQDYAHWRDELFKWFNLPYAQARQGLHRAQRQFDEQYMTGDMFNPLVLLLPALERAYFLQAKLDRMVAALQTIEAIRAYAAEHNSLPESLNQLELPAPHDPVTGEPFEYSVQDDTFSLVGLAPQGEAAKEGVRYEVRVVPAPKAATAPVVSPVTLPSDFKWRGIEAFIHDGTLAVIQIDVAALTSDATWQRISEVLNDAGVGEEVLPMLAEIRTMGEEYGQAGLIEAYVVINITDLPDMPMMVLSLGQGADVEKIVEMFPTPGGSSEFHQIDGALVIATKSQLRFLAESPVQRPRLMKAMALANGAVRVAFAFSDDVRRALEETLSELPPQYGSMPGTTLTRGVEWAYLDLKFQPEITLDVTIQSADAAAAREMLRLIDLATKAMVDHINSVEKDPDVADLLDSFVKSVRPSLNAAQVVLTLDQGKVASLIRHVATPAVRQARQMAIRAASFNNARMLVTALHMWAEDHEGMLPPDLETLVEAGLIAESSLVNPLRPQFGQAGWVYLRPNARVDKLEDACKQILLYEYREDFGEGIVVAFADGHVEWINDESQFQSLLTRSQQAIQPVSQP